MRAYLKIICKYVNTILESGERWRTVTLLVEACTYCSILNHNDEIEMSKRNATLHTYHL